MNSLLVNQKLCFFNSNLSDSFDLYEYANNNYIYRCETVFAVFAEEYCTYVYIYIYI